MKCLFILFVLIKLLFGQFKTDSGFVLVQISENDLKQLGQWPIDRKWFALFIEHAIEQGSQLVFIDIAFQGADPFHPQSDDLFFHLLEKYPVYLRNSQIASDSIVVLGKHKLSQDRFWDPFAEQYQFEPDFIKYESESVQSMYRIISGKHAGDFYIRYPERRIQSLSLSEFLNSSQKLDGKIVVLGLDSKGFSSYIQIPNTDQICTSTEIELFTMMQIFSDQDILYINPYLLYLPLLILSICLYVWRKKRNNLKLSISVFVLNLILISIGFGIQLYLSIFIIIAYLLVPVIAIAYAYYETVVQNKINLRLLKESSGPEHGYVHAEIERLKQQLRFYEEKTDRSTKSELIEENGILYTSKSPMNRLMHRADEVAKSDLNVLITGPTGTGKELMARHIHLKSSRADKPFIIVHCGALTDTLIESELFGHVKGAFTGASQDKTGRFKLADGGSIFLDEIAETSPAFQVKLLRVIQEGTFEAVGSNETIHVDLRIVAATHRHIKEAVNENKFRDDLYYRLAGYELRLPPLTERTMDIRPLFLSILNQIDRHEEIQLSDALFEWLDKQSWPGNIRQLKMLSERAIVNAKSSNRSHLLPADFELSDSSEDSSTDQTGQLVLSQLRKHQFKHRAISLTAQDLNMHRVTVTEYLRGTIIKQFIRSNYSRDDLLKQIAAGTILDNYEQFEKRILGYLETMLSHIKTAIADKLTVEEIRKRYFTNLPNSFMTDLSNLVNYSKERSSL